jgi:O-acetyl-ADP-ribose deacetylase (regulator of RNase III)
MKWTINGKQLVLVQGDITVMDTDAIVNAANKDLILLKARYVIHAVGPRMGEGDEDRKLADATRNSLKLANEKGLANITFPAISTGIFGFPKDRCARIMLTTVAETLKKGDTSLKEVAFCLWGEETLQVFQNEAEELFQSADG